MPPTDQPFHYFKFTREGWQAVESRVVTEMDVSLTVNGEVWLSFLCTPTDLEALAVGFLFNEGILTAKAEIESVRVCQQGDNVDIWLNHGVQKPAHWMRTSGCSGGMTSGKVEVTSHKRIAGPVISPEGLLACLDRLEEAQAGYRETGGIHCSVLVDGQRTYFQAEDVGRHNTLDKLAGRLLLEPVEFSPKIILTTGRVSTEMLAKSQRIGADVILSRTSPTSRSVLLAEELGITLVGYARRSQMFVYAHPERLFTPNQTMPAPFQARNSIDA